MSTVTVSLLGPFEVTLEGRPVDVPRGHQRRLLASLALSAPRAVSQPALVRQLWDSAPPRDPRKAILAQVRRLRDLLGDDLIRSCGDGYQLAVEPEDVDALRFERLVAAATAAPPDRGPELLSDALGLWRGDPLTGVDSPLLDREYGAALVDQRLRAAERWADDNLAQGRPDRGLTYLLDLALGHPLREPLWARLIAALLQSGDAAEARARYEQVRDQVEDTFGAEPGADLQRLHRRIVEVERGDPLWWLSGSDRRLPEVPHRLPPGPVGFAGRADELAALNELTTGRSKAPAGAQTVCAIHGAGGVGKTALALHWGRRVADEFPDGQLYLDLHGHGPGTPLEPTTALTALLQAVGLSPAQLPAELSALTTMLRTRLAGRRMLIILDDAHDSDQVRPLLPGAQATVVVVSRRELRDLQVRDGARPIAVERLDARDGRRLLAHNVPPARVAAEPAAVHRIVELCDGLPLGMRIVADRAAGEPTVALDRIAEEIASAGRDDAAAASLRAVLSWAYDRLPPETAEIFRLLSLHPGHAIGPAGVAALAGCSPFESRRQLDRLVSAHLLEPSFPGRFRLHGLLRGYASELVAADHPRAIADAVRRVVDWCLHSAVRASETIEGSLEIDLPPATGIDSPTFSTSDEAVAWFDAERELLVAAVQTATDHGLYASGQQLADVLRTVFHDRLRYEDFVLIAELGVECARHLNDDEALAHGLRTLGVAYTGAARTEEAAKPLREAVAHAERIDDPRRLASAADGLAINCAEAGDFAAAIAHHRKAVDASRRLGVPRVIGDTLMNLGFTEIASGDCEAGIATTREALTIFEETGAELAAAFAHGNLADAYQRTDHPDLAVDHAQRSLTTLRRPDSLDAAAEVLVTLGRAHQARGNVPEAEAAWWEAADLVGTNHPLSPTLADLLRNARTTTPTARVRATPVRG